MKRSEEITNNLYSEVLRLESIVDTLKLSTRELESKLDTSNTNTRVYRDNLLQATKKNKELSDFICNMLANVGTPISEEIKKYEQHI